MSEPKKGEGGQKPSEPPQPKPEERPDELQAIRENFSTLTEGETTKQESNVPKDEDDQP